ncbi:metal-dependent hydrolase [Sporolactobacillus sp. THM19-2]|jgi:inner membrane protein|uniref:metal-dependent hydrolase n=1 Tax=Sporolactobacillus sp. THM19-2 TaxID=2511171 RepID=UPI0010226482|nr:metal-dependent hydrolase [Sporolactobacillus sp. THM19-2]RYL88909.1 metal-dependent hydrolase [Sporolactobacillus sp. THM19-2]
MDTATHVVIGFGLAGIATLDPAVAGSSLTFQAVMLGTVAGSVIPDIDTVLKLKNNATYIRNHRGMTHSLPVTMLWPYLIAMLTMMIFPGANASHVLFWAAVGVFLHVFSDIFNAYGTQAIRPLSDQWIALGVINIFDPFIFSLHIMGLIIWQTIGHPGITFLIIYAILIAYYILRIHHHHQMVMEVRKQLPNLTKVLLSPTMRWSHYHLAAESADRYYVGKIEGKKLILIDAFNRKPIDRRDGKIRAAMKDKNVRAFLSFSPMYRWTVSERNGRYVIQFTDLRYFSKGMYPFTATVWLNNDLSIQSSYTGWVFSEQKLRKKLVLAQTKA